MPDTEPIRFALAILNEVFGLMLATKRALFEVLTAIAVPFEDNVELL